MTLLILIALIVLGLACSLAGLRHSCAACYAICLALFLGLGCGPIAQWLLKGLQSPYLVRPPFDWSQRNAIVLLGAGTQRPVADGAVEPSLFSYPRLIEAAGLYQDCRKTRADCKIIISGGDPLRSGRPEASVYSDVLVGLGIDAAELMQEPESENTWQNAHFTAAILKRYDPDRVLLVTSATHLRRSMLYFTHFGVNAAPMRADYLSAKLSLLPRAYNFALADMAIREYIGIARYHAYSALGWNLSTHSRR